MKLRMLLFGIRGRTGKLGTVPEIGDGSDFFGVRQIRANPLRLTVGCAFTPGCVRS